MLADQPLAIPVAPDVVQPFRIYPDVPMPRVGITPLHDAELDRIQHGGSRVLCEFESDEQDIIRVAHEGMEWIDAVLAALAVSSGIPVRRSRPIELLEITPGVESKRFVSFLVVEPLLSPYKVTGAEIDFVRMAAVHWRELDNGRRIKRAARRYADALGESDPLVAFQLAYQGLEALEKPLAIELGLEPGAEITRGQCANCGHEFERKKTVLVGVRGLIKGDLHKAQGAERNREWKAISDVRTRIVHGLDDSAGIAGDADKILPAVMHSLHDACAHLVHAHHLEAANYKMVQARPTQHVACGEYTGTPKGPFIPLLTADTTRWARHGGMLVPEFNILRQGGDDVGAYWYQLNVPLASANETDLKQKCVVDPQKMVAASPSKRRAPIEKREQRAAQRLARKKNRKRK